MSYAALKQFLKNIRRNPEQERKEKIQRMFQLKNVVRSRRTHVCYTVVEVNLGSAMLMDSAGDVVIIDWFNSLGQVKTALADRWDLVYAGKPVQPAVEQSLVALS